MFHDELGKVGQQHVEYSTAEGKGFIKVVITRTRRTISAKATLKVGILTSHINMPDIIHEYVT